MYACQYECLKKYSLLSARAHSNDYVLHMQILILAGPFNLPIALALSRLNDIVYLTAGTLRRQGSGMDLKSKFVLEIFIHSLTILMLCEICAFVYDMFMIYSAQESSNPAKLRRNASASANIDSLGSTITPTKSGLSL